MENREANYRNNFEAPGERGQKQQRQNNWRRESQITQAVPQFQPKYVNENTRYFYNNQRFGNTYPKTQGNNDSQNKASFHYDQNFSYPNPNNWFGKTENQICRSSSKQHIERDSKLPELTYNLKDDSQRRELENIEQNKQETCEKSRQLYQERKGETRKMGTESKGSRFHRVKGTT